MFITLDGIDGTGKTTQMRLLGEWFGSQGIDAVLCRDPGGTALGESVRELLLTKSTTIIGRRAELLLYMASRAQLVEEIIAPALDSGKTVVCDRFVLASVCYQGHAGGLPPEEIWDLGRIATAGIEPDLTLLLDLPVAAAMSRIDRQFDRMESQGQQYMERVRQGYLAEAQKDPAVIQRIDATQSIHEMATNIQTVVTQHQSPNSSS